MGRNAQRIQERNTKMYKRYKEMYETKRTRFDDVLKQLADEFYLNEDSVKRIIVSESKEAKKIENE